MKILDGFKQRYAAYWQERTESKLEHAIKEGHIDEAMQLVSEASVQSLLENNILGKCLNAQGLAYMQENPHSEEAGKNEEGLLSNAYNQLILKVLECAPESVEKPTAFLRSFYTYPLRDAMQSSSSEVCIRLVELGAIVEPGTRSFVQEILAGKAEGWSLFTSQDYTRLRPFAEYFMKNQIPEIRKHPANREEQLDRDLKDAQGELALGPAHLSERQRLDSHMARIVEARREAIEGRDRGRG